MIILMMVIFEFRKNVITLKETKYQTDIDNRCTTGKSD